MLGRRPLGNRGVPAAAIRGRATPPHAAAVPAATHIKSPSVKEQWNVTTKGCIVTNRRMLRSSRARITMFLWMVDFFGSTLTATTFHRKPAAVQLVLI